MTPRRMMPAGLLLAAAAVVVQAAPATAPVVYKTPNEVFAAAQEAQKKEDFKAFYECLTPDSQKLMTGQVVLTGAMLKGLAALDKTGKAGEAVKALEVVFKKHGVTEESLKNIPPAKDAKDAAKTLRSLAALVKDPPTFFGDFITTMNKVNGQKGKPPFTDATLAEVKVTGDKAAAMIVHKADGKEHKEPAEFQKVGMSWKIVMPEPKPRPPLPAQQPPKLPPPKR